MADSMYMKSALHSEQLDPWLPRRDLTIEELVEAADGLLAEVAPVQKRYKVTARPDLRTIRYYVSQGLLPKPLGYDGGRAHYAATHLLRLLLIKKLQAEHLTLARIKRQLRGATDEEVLAALLGATDEPLGRSPAHRQLAPLRSEAAHPDEERRQHPQMELALTDAEGPLGRLLLSLRTVQEPERRARLALCLEQLAAQLKREGDHG